MSADRRCQVVVGVKMWGEKDCRKCHDMGSVLLVVSARGYQQIEMSANGGPQHGVS